MKKEKKKEYKADYQGATPEQVARALLKFRPKEGRGPHYRPDRKPLSKDKE